MYKILDTMERDWTHEQKALLKEKLKESISKNNRDNFVDAILNKCKEHGGPITSLEDLNKLCEKHDAGSLKKMLRQEIQYQKATSDERQPRTARAIQG